MLLTINTSEIILGVLPYMLGAFGVALGFQILMIKLEKMRKEKYGESSSERINRLASSLKEATRLSSEIESEITRRHKMVRKLKDDVKRYDSLAKLKSSEVEAIVQTFGGELQKESNKSLFKGALINFVFFIFGAILTYYFK